MRKLLAFLFTAVVLQATPALALVGGPWDNNQHEGNSDGIYSATITLRNGIGMARWGQVAGFPEISRFSESVIWYRGAVYFGVTYGNVDFMSRRVTGVTEGEVNAPRSLGTKAGGPVGFCNTSWTGKVTSVPNSMSFSAKGDAAFFGDYSDEFLPAQTVETTTTDVVITDPATGAGTTTVTVTTQTFPGASGPNAAFPQYRTRTKVLVYGSRIASIGLRFGAAPRVGVGSDAVPAGGGGVPGGGVP